MTAPGIVRLSCKAQTYAWGKVGPSSKVAELTSLGAGKDVVDASKPYAELWMGTHPNAPTVFYNDDSTTLATHLATHPEQLSPELAERYNNTLPFLFKVLSIAKALSIQAHPDKSLAESLHAKRPDLYKDPNHKPEMALALTDFEALVGFRPVEEIAKFLNDFPEFKNVVGEDVATEFTGLVASKKPTADMKAGLKKLFTALMTADNTLIQQQLTKLMNRMKSDYANDLKQKGSVAEVVSRLHSQFPGDVGCFCLFILNFVALGPGGAIYLKANEPHAYISGDIVECMATSDNVVRAGLTPKHKDVQVLTNMLTYSYGPASSQVMQGQDYQSSKYTKLYDPPIDEFSVLRTVLPSGATESMQGVHGPSIVLVIEGDNIALENGNGDSFMISKGHVYFVAADVPLKLENRGQKEVVLFRAFCDA